MFSYVDFDVLFVCVCIYIAWWRQHTAALLKYHGGALREIFSPAYLAILLPLPWGLGVMGKKANGHVQVSAACTRYALYVRGSKLARSRNLELV